MEFEGEYFNGKMWNGKEDNIIGNKKFEIENGKGYIKEYSFMSEKLEFEGEYLKGERNGKGKEYNFFGDIKFEAEYLNGKRII